MTERALGLVLAVSTACTLDVDLGARSSPVDAAVTIDACVCNAADGCNACPQGACDPANGNLCECDDTAECPANFYCVPDSNTDPNTAGFCTPPADCNADPDGNLSCPNGNCNAGDPNCVAAPDCSGANSCSNNQEMCCPGDNKCYPANCVGCCANT